MLQAQIEGALADLQAHFVNLFRPETWLRTLINTVAVGLVFVLALKGLSRIGGKPGKAIAGALGV